MAFIGLDKGFGDIMPKAQATNAKISKFDCENWKLLQTNETEEAVNRMKII